MLSINIFDYHPRQKTIVLYKILRHILHKLSHIANKRHTHDNNYVLTVVLRARSHTVIATAKVIANVKSQIEAHSISIVLFTWRCRESSQAQS